MTAPRVIAIDGPAGSGKTTTARAVARALGFAHLDSGALYRAVTLAGLEAGAVESVEGILAAAQAARVALVYVGDGFRPEADGVDVSQAVRSAKVTDHVSRVASRPAVREWVNQRLRAAAATHPKGVVVDGRDIGTVVFPDAPLKVFLTASPEVRAERRLAQDGRAVNAESLQRAAGELRSRDDADRRRPVAPLKAAPDAVLLDSTGMSFEQQVGRILDLARNALGLEPA
jgi:cytidylate kinase